MIIAPLTLDIGGQAGLVEARDGLRRWLAEVGTEKDVRDDIVLACWEATANAIEHPLADDVDIQVKVRAVRQGDHVVVSVSDSGRWREREPGNVREERGLGLKLIRALMDRVQIVPTATGTEVVMWRRIASRCR
jgi:anti-sigma regulatory factor (Ser/Thr protein kinase)